MSVSDLDHVAIAVKDLDNAVATYKKLFSNDPHYENVPDQGVRIAAFELEDSRVELIEPLNDDSNLHRFLDEHGEGIHHVALRTDDVDEELDRAHEVGLDRIDETSRSGAQGYEIGFLHPKGLHGCLMELAEPPSSEERE